MSVDSILDSTKESLGVSSDNKDFDFEICMLINSALYALYQLGVGSSPYTITQEHGSWNEFFEGRRDLEIAKTAVYLRVKIVWDPPQSSYVLEALKAQLSEAEWRLNIQAERGTR